MTKCSDWSQEYRILGPPFPGPLNFKYFPWAREMHDCTHELIIGQKAAQMAFTETAMDRVFHQIDIFHQSVLYILPTKSDASDFSNGRFDPALETSVHLASFFSDTSNMGHKRAGLANLYLRGSRSRSGLKSIPCAIIIFDEVDEMFADNISLALERSSGQLSPSAFLLSTPSYENMGINAWFKDSDQSIFIFKCPSCSRRTHMIFPDCLVITAEELNDPRIDDSYICCKECKNKLTHELKYEWLADGQWEPQVTSATKGYTIPQFYSSTVSPAKLATKFLRGLTNPDDEKEWYNSSLGQTYEAKGARVTDDQLKSVTGGHLKFDHCPSEYMVTMGVDVGKFFHIEIDKWHFDASIPTTDVNIMATCQLISEQKTADVKDLDQLMRDFNVNYCVIDCNPERRVAMEFAERWFGFVKLCNYTSTSDKHLSIRPEQDHFLSADRTFWLDLSLRYRFQKEKIILPIDCSIEYKNHVKANVRIVEKDATGNETASYVKKKHVEDHFAHSRNYNEIALPLAVGMARAEDIEGLF